MLLFCLGMCILLIGLLYMYFNNKFAEQEQKITAMFDIISTVVERSTGTATVEEPEVCERVSSESKKIKIPVLDGGEFDDSDSEPESDDDSDSSTVVLDEQEQSDEIFLPRFADENILVMSEITSLDEKNLEDVKIINFEEGEKLEEKLEEKAKEKEEEEPITLEESYKKMNLGKLRSIVLEKGLATDTTKLKKPELLKLLSDTI